MIPLADIFGIPDEALTLLFLIALSLVNWIKNRFLAEQEKKQQEQAPEDPMREVIWRRQVGETADPREDPRGRGGPPPIPAPVSVPVSVPVPPGTIRFDPKPVPPRRSRPPQAAPKPVPAPALRPVVPVVTARQAALADAFESSQRGGKTQRTGHRREIDKLLRSPSAAQNAILLMEILGPPVALKPHKDPFA